MSTKPLRLLIFSFVYFLLLGSSHTILAQRYGTERFKQKYEINSDKVLHVNIDIDSAVVRLSKSSRSKEVRLSIYFSEDEFKIYEDYDRKRSRLDIEFDKKGWTNSDSKDLKAEFVLELPQDVEIDLEARIKAGEIEIDLGGLSLVGLDLITWAGEVQVEFSEPNWTEMDFLKINTKVGETEIVRLGNARFKEAEINGGIGKMRVDFRGRMLNEAMADVDLDIRVPEDFNAQLRFQAREGRIRTDFPISVRRWGDEGEKLDDVLGEGLARLSVYTEEGNINTQKELII